MAKRVWKFVGGPKAARTSLKAAVAASLEKPEGEVAIYNSETGDLYNRIGEEFSPVVAHQYEKIVNVFSLILAHARTGEPVPSMPLAGMILSVGGSLLSDSAEGAQEITRALYSNADHSEEGADNEGPGSS